MSCKQEIDFLSKHCKTNSHDDCHGKWKINDFVILCNCPCHVKMYQILENTENSELCDLKISENRYEYNDIKICNFGLSDATNEKYNTHQNNITCAVTSRKKIGKNISETKCSNTLSSLILPGDNIISNRHRRWIRYFVQ